MPLTLKKTPNPNPNTDATTNKDKDEQTETALALAGNISSDDNGGASDLTGSSNSNNNKDKSKGKGKGKGKGNKRYQELWPIPVGLEQEFMALVTSTNQWHQQRIQPPGVDPLNLNGIVSGNKDFRARMEALTGDKKAKARAKEPLVCAVKLLALAGPSHLPIATTFKGGKSYDPTLPLVQKLDITNDSNLLGAGIELLTIPAVTWRKMAQGQLDTLDARIMQLGLARRQALSTANPNGQGKKAADTGAAARYRKQEEETTRLKKQVATKLEEWGDGFLVYPRLWVYGLKRSALARIKLLESELTKYALATGNRFSVVDSFVEEDPTKLLSLVRSYPILIKGQPEPNVLTPNELAGLWHLPNDKFEVAGLKRAGAMSPPPAQSLIWRTILPNGTEIINSPEWRREYGRVLAPDGSIWRIGLNERSILKATACTGRPGSGKSVNIESFAIQDMLRNDTANIGKGNSSHPCNSVIISDPNGDLIYDTIDRIPHSHLTRTCVVDPLDPEWVVGLNPLAVPTIQKYDQAELDNLFESLGGGIPANGSDNRPLDANLIKILMQENRQYGMEGLIAAQIQEIFAKTMGVSMDTTPTIFRVLQNAILLAVRSSTTATFKSLYRIVTNPIYRQACLQSLDYVDELSQNFWLGGEMETLEKNGGAALMPTKSRLESLLRSDPISLLFGQARSTVSIKKMIDTGNNIFFRFSPQLTGNKPFMLAVTFNLIKQAVFSRTEEKAQRRLVSVYLDEFQEMVGADAATLQIWLEQARKFGGAVFLGHQNLDQVAVLLKAIKGTVSNMMPMSVGPSDRKWYATEMDTPAWPADQIINAFQNLPAYASIGQFQYNGVDYAPVLLDSMVRQERMPSLIPAMIARNAPVSEQIPVGYELIPLAEQSAEQWQQLLQVSKRDGYEGFWEATPAGAAQGYQAVSISPSNLSNFIEELTRHLYKRGKLNWGVNPTGDPQGFNSAGLDVGLYRRDPAALKQAQQLLLEIERIPEQQNRQKRLEELGEADWQLYRATQLSRNKVLLNYLTQHENILPDQRSRVLTYSRLQYGTSVAVAKAETRRPDRFLMMIERGEVDLAGGGLGLGGDENEFA